MTVDVAIDVGQETRRSRALLDCASTRQAPDSLSGAFFDQAPQEARPDRQGSCTLGLCGISSTWRQPDHTASPGAALDGTGACVVWLCPKGCRVVALWGGRWDATLRPARPSRSSARSRIGQDRCAPRCLRDVLLPTLNAPPRRVQRPGRGADRGVGQDPRCDRIHSWSWRPRSCSPSARRSLARLLAEVRVWGWFSPSTRRRRVRVSSSS